MCEDKDIPVWKLNVAIMQGGRQDLRLSLPLPKIENPNDAKQFVVQKTSRLASDTCLVLFHPVLRDAVLSKA